MQLFWTISRSACSAVNADEGRLSWGHFCHLISSSFFCCSEPARSVVNVEGRIDVFLGLDEVLHFRFKTHSCFPGNPRRRPQGLLGPGKSSTEGNGLGGQLINAAHHSQVRGSSCGRKTSARTCCNLLWIPKNLSSQSCFPPQASLFACALGQCPFFSSCPSLHHRQKHGVAHHRWGRSWSCNHCIVRRWCVVPWNHHLRWSTCWLGRRRSRRIFWLMRSAWAISPSISMPISAPISAMIATMVAMMPPAAVTTFPALGHVRKGPWKS